MLLGVAYAMVVQNLALGIIGGLLLATPVVLIGGVDSGCLLRSSQGKEGAIDRHRIRSLRLETASAD